MNTTTALANRRPGARLRRGACRLGARVRRGATVSFLCLIFSVCGPANADDALSMDPGEVPDLFVSLLIDKGADANELLARIEANWQPGMVPMALETWHFTKDMRISTQLLGIVKRHTGKDYGFDNNNWFRWFWSQPEQRHPAYASFKSKLYENIDPKFAGYFSEERETLVRLDEIRWGGVLQDGIPPLRYPKMIKAVEAGYLADTDVVFALKYGDDSRAYPKRILAWHEMFIDTINGVEYAGVYCTLCGAVIMYETNHNGVRHELGTSGFLYRSNKVMYDRATQSLWNTTFGEPVSGPLVGKGIALKRSHIVTTTWGEWRRRHPQTTVLSMDTGYERNYGEGVAYSSYFNTDDLMFTVPRDDSRLANKAEILALQFPQKTEKILAISAEFLSANSVYHHAMDGGVKLVVLTDASGANRVYAAHDLRIDSYDGDLTAIDTNGGRWTLTEAELTGPDGARRERLPAHRAFWFGWVAVHEDTELVK